MGLRILDRYLAWAVIAGTLLTLGVLLPLLGFFVLANELEQVGVAGYRLQDALLFMVLSLPRYAYQVFPIATLIGALLGLGALANRSELVAMRAAGVSVGRIAGAGLLGGVLLAAGAMLIGEVVAPVAEQRGIEIKRAALSGAVTQQTESGFWAIDQGTYINIREILSGTSLRDIFIYQADNAAGTLIATHAQGARYQNHQWVLEGLSRSRVSMDGVQVERLPNAVWSSLLNPGILEVVVVDPRILPVWGLWKYIRFMTVNAQDASNYQVIFWGRVLYPLLTLSMVLVAIPVLLGSARSRGTGVRAFFAVLVGILYYLVSKTFSYLALLYGLSPLAAALAPPVLFIGAALLLLRRVG
ncbi:LPS export ABC transporter permease LptG [Candidatus Thiodictyon syntrophicum]|jgi:lipopolysaccharide export system permease protein|uniref:LPS export ABC transporter permease LptG n=1 Tax=Candidatus Thiodictyon syntrophicum TaxID=1166950 RepID=A0A2K8U6R1_9GAMM|nr:LPS export ABC transporter permease LptG [Candidatus Thiodictyon syntrophicum]AUB81280.1 LPS export ABC transporter permease LptG [Candidatus Thiodictyon syntrophicum]